MKYMLILITLKFIYSQKEELSIDILPSDRYKLNKRELSILKSDIERQVKFEIIKVS